MIDQYWSRTSDEGWDGWSTALPMVDRSISPFVATQRQPDPRAELSIARSHLSLPRNVSPIRAQSFRVVESERGATVHSEPH